MLVEHVEQLLRTHFPDAEPRAYGPAAHAIVGRVLEQHRADVDVRLRDQLARALRNERWLHERRIEDDRVIRVLGEALRWYADERHWDGPVPVHEHPSDPDRPVPDEGRVARAARDATRDAFPR